MRRKKLRRRRRYYNSNRLKRLSKTPVRNRKSSKLAKESASTGSEEVVGAPTVVDPNTDLVGDQSTCTESFKDLFCNPALQCIAGIPCPGQGCCDRTSCNPADSCMPGIPIPGIGCCRDAEDWRPEWGPSRIDKSNPSALVNVVLEDGTPKSIMVSELDDYIESFTNDQPTAERRR